MALTATCAYRVDAALIELLDARLGPPLDSYFRGWQVWLEDHGPNGETLEWRLHPPARFRMPRGENPHDLFGDVLQALANAAGPEGDALSIASQSLTLSQIWEVLEVFPTFGDELEPAAVAAAADEALGRSADVAGYVDHSRMGDDFKGRSGDYSVGTILLNTLEPLTS